MMKRRDRMEMIRMVVTLLVIAFVCSSILGVVNAVTKDRIAEIAAENLAAAMRQVLPEATDFRETTAQLSAEFLEQHAVTARYEGLSASGTLVGYVVLTAPRGFGGAIAMTVGVDTSDTVTGVVITEQSETPGLGAKADNADYLSRYIGKSGTLTVVKGEAGENQVSAITGATVTSKAVTAGVQAALRAAAE